MPRGVYLHKKGGNSGSFKKGIVPWSKSQKGVCLNTGRTHFKKGQSTWIGKKLSKDHRDKTVKNLKCGRGKDSGAWKGGLTSINKLVRSSPEFKQWRIDVFLRDNFTCKTCEIRGKKMEAHHIFSFSNIVKLNGIKTMEDALLCNALWDIGNGVTLCNECHKLTPNYKGRKSLNNITNVV